MRILTVTDPAAVSKVFASLSGELAFDIGANCGQSVDRLLPNYKKIVAVEPAAESFEVLQMTYGTYSAVMLVDAACTDHEGFVTLDERDVIDSGQLTSGEPTDTLGWGDVRSTREVRATTVDALADHYGTPDLLKVDVEGHEVQVLQGATNVLATKPRVLIEIHSEANGHACRDILDGFDLREVHAHAYPPGSHGARNHYWLVS